MKKRGLDFFYIVGTNDSVSPALLKLGEQHPDFPHYIVPGGQHGGPADAGFSTRTPQLPATTETYRTFCLAHFFHKRTLPEAPEISVQNYSETDQATITATFANGIEPENNSLAWSENRHRPYTLAFEYDTWQKLEMKKIGPGTYEATIPLGGKPIEFLTTHTDTSNGLPFHFSSSLRRLSRLDAR